MKTTTFNQKLGRALACLSLCALVVASAETINVNPGDSIQAAVDAAASGDTIQIAAGVYEEQVVVMDKDLDLVGEAGATLKAPAAMTTTLAPVTTRRAVLGILRSEVNVSGVTFDGNSSGAANARLVGVYHLSASGTVANCSFQGFRSVPRNLVAVGNRETGYIAANAVAAAGPDVTHVEVRDSTFINNEAGIVLLGDDTGANPNPEQLRQTFVVEGNSIIGIGVATNNYQFGVRINLGTSGQVLNNTIRDHLSGGNFAGFGMLGSAAVFVRDNPGLRPTDPRTTQQVLVEGNALVNNQAGIDLLQADGSRAVNNQIEAGGTESGVTNEGGIALSGNDVGAVNNRISNASIGINVVANPALGTAHDAMVIANRISGAAIPINEQAGVTGTRQHANKISP